MAEALNNCFSGESTCIKNFVYVKLNISMLALKNVTFQESFPIKIPKVSASSFRDAEKKKFFNRRKVELTF